MNVPASPPTRDVRPSDITGILATSDETAVSAPGSPLSPSAAVRFDTPQTVIGTDENDTPVGDSRNDGLNGSTGEGELHRGAGNEFLEAWIGDDELWDFHDADQLLGWSKNDVLEVCKNNDQQLTEGGEDDLYCGERHLRRESIPVWTGNDQFLFAERLGGETIDFHHGDSTPPGRMDPQTPSQADDLHRQVLGLPSGRPLVATEVKQAFREAVKTAHPDYGGDKDAFGALVEARDALLKVS